MFRFINANHKHAEGVVKNLFAHKDLVGLRELCKEEILDILDMAAKLKPSVEDAELRQDIFKKRSIITLFYENSTRTKTSFALAGSYLGAIVSDLGVSTSSVQKGESLIDTAKTLDEMNPDIIVIRHSMTGVPDLVARNVKASVINAGDGTNEHPTQALLDLFTIYEKLGSFEGLKVTIAGDIANSRVARSNVFGLVKLGAKVTLAGPKTLLTDRMKGLGAIVTSNIEEAVREADVVMGLRIQKERLKRAPFPDTREYGMLFGINNDILKLAKKDALIMHPGPVNRGIELSSSVVDGHNSVINVQVKNGVAVRMAVIYRMMTKGVRYEKVNKGRTGT